MCDVCGVCVCGVCVCGGWVCVVCVCVVCVCVLCVVWLCGWVGCVWCAVACCGCACAVGVCVHVGRVCVEWVVWVRWVYGAALGMLGRARVVGRRPQSWVELSVGRGRGGRATAAPAGVMASIVKTFLLRV